MLNENVPPFKQVLEIQGFGGGGVELHRPHKKGHAFLIGLVELQASFVNNEHLGSSCWQVKFEHSKPE